MDQKEKEKLFLTILDNHENQVYRVCWGFADDPNDVNDLFQESIIRIWQGIDGFKGKSSLSTWIYRISVNTCIFWKKQRNSMHFFNDIENEIILPTVPSIEDRLINDEKIIILKKAIQLLSKIDRTLILLYMEKCTYKEIAEITGLSVTNVGAKINRIKQRLKILINHN